MGPHRDTPWNECLCDDDRTCELCRDNHSRSITEMVVEARDELRAEGRWPDTPNARIIDAEIDKYQDQKGGWFE